jgi:hypothetical protein
MCLHSSGEFKIQYLINLLPRIFKGNRQESHSKDNNDIIIPDMLHHGENE